MDNLKNAEDFLNNNENLVEAELRNENLGEDQTLKTAEAVVLNSDVLPTHVWELILSRLPVRWLLTIPSVCKPWRSIVRSSSFLNAYKEFPWKCEDVFFMLFADYSQKSVAAYDPSEDRWFVIPMSYLADIKRGIVSSKGLLTLEGDEKGEFTVCNPVTKSKRKLAPLLPPKSTYVVAMVVYPQRGYRYKLLAVTTGEVLTSQVYDSATDSWKPSGQFQGRFALLDAAVYLDGFLFCLTHAPHCMVAFDLEIETWHLVDVTMPSVVSSHLFEHDGSLILVGGVEEHGVLKKISIWKLDARANVWQIVCDMPADLFSKFSHVWPCYHFYAVCLQGRICFYRNRSPNIFMYDLRENRWWLLPPCPYESCLSKPNWFGIALAPRLDASV